MDESNGGTRAIYMYIVAPGLVTVSCANQVGFTIILNIINMELVFYIIATFIRVFMRVLRSLMIIKSSKLHASLMGSFTAVISVVLTKLIVKLDTIFACSVAAIIYFIGCYLAMDVYERRIQKKDVVNTPNSKIISLDEAIEHCDNIAEEHKCDSCGQQHAQLGAWLRELKRLIS